jgi:hypothetical protein
MRVFFAVAMIALLTNSAYAQSAAPDNKADTKSQAEIEAEKQADRAYKRSLGNIPNHEPGDPWGAVRAPDAPKAAAKTATAKSKVNSKTGAAH